MRLFFVTWPELAYGTQSAAARYRTLPDKNQWPKQRLTARLVKMHSDTARPPPTQETPGGTCASSARPAADYVSWRCQQTAGNTQEQTQCTE